jgi:hypothetical protein
LVTFVTTIKLKKTINMKNLLRYFLLLITAGLMFSACQKELSAETGTSKGALVKDAGGNCSPATPNGTFKQDTALTNNNYVDIQVNITEIGVYFITTDTLNGYYFKASGVTALTGANTIRLVGVGKPQAVGTDLFTVKFDGSECDFPVIVLDATGGGGGGGNANFTFDCSNPVFAGTYAAGTPMTAANKITIKVNVITAGNYTLTITNANGISFSPVTGTLPATPTLQTIELIPTGTPSFGGTFPVQVSGNGITGCIIPLVCTGTPAPTGIIQCQVDGTLRTFNVTASATYNNTQLFGLNGLVITGDNNTTDNESILLALGLTGAGAGTAITPFVYNTNQLATCLIAANYDPPTGAGFGVISGIPVAVPFTIEITSINATNVKGKFFGPLGTKIISSGTFDVPII